MPSKVYEMVVESQGRKRKPPAEGRLIGDYEVVRARVRIEVDIDKLFRTIGVKALLNASGKSSVSIGIKAKRMGPAAEVT